MDKNGEMAQKIRVKNEGSFIDIASQYSENIWNCSVF